MIAVKIKTVMQVESWFYIKMITGSIPEHCLRKLQVVALPLQM